MPIYLGSIIAGVVSFLTPCVLPLVPGYISYISGVSLSEMGKSDGKDDSLKNTLPIIYCTLSFIGGFTVIFIAGGATAFALGSAISGHKDILMRLAGEVIILLGLYMIGVLRIGALDREWRFQGGKGGSITGAFLLGMAFAFGWSPCLGPIVGTMLTMASEQETVFQAIGLMILYSIGLAVPFLLTGLAMDTFFKLFDRIKKHLHKIEIGAGVILIILGNLMLLGLFDYLRVFFAWILPEIPTAY